MLYVFLLWQWYNDDGDDDDDDWCFTATFVYMVG